MVAPGIGGLVCGADLIDSPRTFANSVATFIAKIFDEVVGADSKPTSLISRLFFDSHRKRVVELGQRMLKQSYRVGSCPLDPFD